MKISNLVIILILVALQAGASSCSVPFDLSAYSSALSDQGMASPLIDCVIDQERENAYRQAQDSFASRVGCALNSVDSLQTRADDLKAGLDTFIKSKEQAIKRKYKEKRREAQNNLFDALSVPGARSKGTAWKSALIEARDVMLEAHTVALKLKMFEEGEDSGRARQLKDLVDFLDKLKGNEPTIHSCLTLGYSGLQSSHSIVERSKAMKEALDVLKNALQEIKKMSDDLKEKSDDLKEMSDDLKKLKVLMYEVCSLIFPLMVPSNVGITDAYKTRVKQDLTSPSATKIELQKAMADVFQGIKLFIGQAKKWSAELELLQQEKIQMRSEISFLMIVSGTLFIGLVFMTFVYFRLYAQLKVLTKQ